MEQRIIHELKGNIKKKGIIMNEHVTRDPNMDLESLFKTSEKQSTEKPTEEANDNIVTLKKEKKTEPEKTPLERMLDHKKEGKDESGLVVDQLTGDKVEPKKDILKDNLIKGADESISEMDELQKKMLLAKEQGFIKRAPSNTMEVSQFMDEVSNLEIVVEDGKEKVIIPTKMRKDRGDHLLTGNYENQYLTEVYISDDPNRLSVQDQIKKNQENKSDTSNDGDPAVDDIPDEKTFEDALPDEETIRKYAERKATIHVIINKTGMNVEDAGFTEDEMKVLQTATVINFNEIVDEDLRTLNIDDIPDISAEDETFDEIMMDGYVDIDGIEGPLTPVTFPCSGFRAYMKSLTGGDLMNYSLQGEELQTDEIIDNLSILYRNMVKPTIPIKDFSDFTHKLAFTDMKMATWGAMISTHGTMSKVPMRCGNDRCGKGYDLEFNTRKLIDYNEMSDRYLELMKSIVTCDTLTTDSIAKKSPLNNVKRIRLPRNNRIVVDFGLRSCADMIYDTLPLVSLSMEQFKETFKEIPTRVCGMLVVGLPYIKSVYVMNKKGEMKKYNKTRDIIKALYYFTKPGDIELIEQIARSYVNNYECVNFYLPESDCPHCKYHSGKVGVDIDFLESRMASESSTTSVELKNIVV